jgi:hypothetical protein
MGARAQERLGFLCGRRGRSRVELRINPAELSPDRRLARSARPGASRYWRTGLCGAWAYFQSSRSWCARGRTERWHPNLREPERPPDGERRWGLNYRFVRSWGKTAIGFPFVRLPVMDRPNLTVLTQAGYPADLRRQARYRGGSCPPWGHPPPRRRL